MRTYTQDFIIYGQTIATASCPTDWVGKTPVPPPSRLFLCKYCGKEYARVVVFDTLNCKPSRFIPYMRCCEDCWLFRPTIVHYSQVEIPDSVYVALDKNYLAHLPHDILLWELRCLDLHQLKLPLGNAA